jgi:CheY-like chemotaxis protein
MRIGTQNSGALPPKAVTILLVEDELLVSNTVAEYLLRSGFEVLAAIDVEAALGLLQSRQIDVVFSDVRLPGGRSSFDLARLSRCDGRASECCSPAVFTSRKATCTPADAPEETVQAGRRRAAHPLIASRGNGLAR